MIELKADQDYRLAHMRALSTLYFTPLGDAAAAFVKASYEELAQGVPAAASVLRVNGREVHLPAVHGDYA